MSLVLLVCIQVFVSFASITRPVLCYHLGAYFLARFQLRFQVLLALCSTVAGQDPDDM